MTVELAAQLRGTGVEFTDVEQQADAIATPRQIHDRTRVPSVDRKGRAYTAWTTATAVEVRNVSVTVHLRMALSHVSANAIRSMNLASDTAHYRT